MSKSIRRNSSVCTKRALFAVNHSGEGGVFAQAEEADPMRGMEEEDRAQRGAFIGEYAVVAAVIHERRAVFDAKRGVLRVDGLIGIGTPADAVVMRRDAERQKPGAGIIRETGGHADEGTVRNNAQLIRLGVVPAAIRPAHGAGACAEQDGAAQQSAFCGGINALGAPIFGQEFQAAARGVNDIRPRDFFRHFLGGGAADKQHVRFAAGGGKPGEDRVVRRIFVVRSGREKQQMRRAFADVRHAPLQNGTEGFIGIEPAADRDDHAVRVRRFADGGVVPDLLRVIVPYRTVRDQSRKGAGHNAQQQGERPHKKMDLCHKLSSSPAAT